MVTEKDIIVEVKEQQIEKIRKYVPDSHNPNAYETAATHGLVDGKLLGIIERGQYYFVLSNGDIYHKNNKNVTWLRLYEIDYENIDFPTW